MSTTTTQTNKITHKNCIKRHLELRKPAFINWEMPVLRWTACLKTTRIFFPFQLEECLPLSQPVDGALVPCHYPPSPQLLISVSFLSPSTAWSPHPTNPCLTPSRCPPAFSNNCLRQRNDENHGLSQNPGFFPHIMEGSMFCCKIYFGSAN